MSADGTAGVEQLLAAARAGLARVEPEVARAEAAQGAVIVDIRDERRVAAEGAIPGARRISRNVLEWRLDPACTDADRTIARPGARVILVCDERYQSSLAAATLRGFGIDATDVIGGFRAWQAGGLPVVAAAPE